MKAYASTSYEQVFMIWGELKLHSKLIVFDEAKVDDKCCDPSEKVRLNGMQTTLVGKDKTTNKDVVGNYHKDVGQIMCLNFHGKSNTLM